MSDALTKEITDPDPAAAKRAFDAMMQMERSTLLQSRQRAGALTVVRLRADSEMVERSSFRGRCKFWRPLA